MAAVKGVNATIYTAGGESQIAAGYTDARVKAYYDTYVPLGTEAAGSTINVGPVLPAGAKILGVTISNLTQDAAVTLSVGDSNDPDRYITAYAADSVLYSDNLRQIGMGYVIGTNSGDTQVQILTAGATLGINDSISIVILVATD